jgi:hypothetical protein
MSGRQRLHIFHIYRKDGTPLFLHPFLDRQKVMDRLEKYELLGLYGREPRVESLTMFRNELYRIIEDEVRGWVSEARFIPRFLMSAGIFVVAYFFLSFVVRDPLPLVDELAVSLGAGIVGYLLLGRRYMRSEGALKKRIALREKVDGVRFVESEFVAEIERALHDTEATSTEGLIRAIEAGEVPALSDPESDEAKEFLQYLETKFGSGEYRRQEKKLLEKGRSKDLEGVKRWVQLRKVDFPLFALYVNLKRQQARKP